MSSEPEYSYRLAKCTKCGRKILVESFLFGVDHTASLGVTCAACLNKDKIPDSFTAKHPEAAW